jgi:hypothetical protein
VQPAAAVMHGELIIVGIVPSRRGYVAEDPALGHRHCSGRRRLLYGYIPSIPGNARCFPRGVSV